jgi:eukaryotic-like serine/threonine-protein kinase
MSLAAGSRVGPYEILSAIGAGGMGEVYRATDTNLGRDVAIKVLPEAFAQDPERIARFEREAKVLASLNHPNIAIIHGLEKSQGTYALVMELVEGEDLSQRIARGPIPVDEALPIAKQIAEALEAAHEQGIVHRDLKPANIKVRPDGTVKVLDFGLAKLTESSAAAVNPSTLSMSPTITSPAMTVVGVLLGTAAYMSPEQARGKPADKRSDIWAFGCVLYEMLTARRAFDAGEVSDTLAMVLMKDIDWTSLTATTPHAIRTLLRRCLEKDRKRRLPDIGVARLEIDEALAAPAAETRQDQPAVARHQSRLAWGVAALAACGAMVVGILHFSAAPSAPPSPVRFQVLPPIDGSFTSTEPNEPHALSPDGKHLVFRATRAGQVRLVVHNFDADDARELPGTEGVAGGVFWSPDSRFVAFSTEGRLKKVDITGGPPQVICDLPTGTIQGTWGPDGTVLLGVAGLSLGQGGSGLLRVSSRGGTPTLATTLDAARKELLHGHPWFLPDGRHFLYWVIGAPLSPVTAGQHSIYVGSLDGGPPVSLGVSDSKAVYANGFLLFVRDATLLAEPFDAASRTATGDPLVIAQDIPSSPTNGSALFSASVAGVVSYGASAAQTLTQLTWFDRAGKVLGTAGEKADQTALRLSPDQTRVAISVFDPARRTRDIWIHDLARNVRTRFTFDAREDWNSVWSPDGRQLAFSADRMGRLDIYRKSASGSGAEEPLVESPVNKYVYSWSTDGRFLLFNTGGGGSQTGTDVWVLPLSGERKPRPIVQSPFNEIAPSISPDGRWVAYRSNESGRIEVYVVPFESQSGKWQVSTSGGDLPKWRGDGKELFFLADNTMMAADVDGTGSSFRVGSVRPLFHVNRRTASYLGFGTGSVFDVTADGQRFLVNVLGNDQPVQPRITVITNWTATLGQR